VSGHRLGTEDCSPGSAELASQGGRHSSYLSLSSCTYSIRLNSYAVRPGTAEFRP